MLKPHTPLHSYGHRRHNDPSSTFMPDGPRGLSGPGEIGGRVVVESDSRAAIVGWRLCNPQVSALGKDNRLHLFLDSFLRRLFYSKNVHSDTASLAQNNTK